MKNKKTIILLLLIAIVGVVGLTLAYFSNTASVENEFNTKQYGTTVEEVFTSPDDWTPGTTTDKTLTVTNSGQVDEAVRVFYTESWTSKNSNQEGDLSLTQNNNRAAIINFANSSDWTKVTENNKDYYYYNYKLAPGEVTSTLLDSVTFNSAITNQSNCSTSETSTGKQVVCSSTGAGYDGATYKLVFTVETVQYDKYADAWETEASIANSSKPLIVKGLKYNASDKTYENGDRSAMFAFSHPQTEQMKATIDYRYIGNIPNNYVKFNCDNDGTNCEIWRIIGVFEVDDGNGNYETRIKLVRGSAFAETMAWDNSNYINEWTTATLKIFLNGDYLNDTGDALNYGLKEFAQSQVEDAKYYLGGRKFGSEEPRLGSTEEMYTWERENNVYNEDDIVRSTYWKGTVGLMYPSDYAYTYSMGVDDHCYNDPNDCFHTKIYYEGVYPDGQLITIENYAKPQMGWIYNSSNFENQASYIWLLSPGLDYYGSVFAFGDKGFVTHSSYYGTNDISSCPMAVRPVVYLKSSIQITGGEGTEQNPYVLG